MTITLFFGTLKVFTLSMKTFHALSLSRSLSLALALSRSTHAAFGLCVIHSVNIRAHSARLSRQIPAAARSVQASTRYSEHLALFFRSKLVVVFALIFFGFCCLTFLLSFFKKCDLFFREYLSNTL